MYNRKAFFDNIRPIFRDNSVTLTKKHVSAIEFLLDKFENDPHWTDIRHVAYAFATIARETAWTFLPITEYGGKKYFTKYDVGKLAKQLGNTPEADGDGYLYRGRGYVQITGRTNYEKFGIEDAPEKALDPEFAFHIMTRGMFEGVFTGRKITDYINDTKTGYFNARKVINGLDKAAYLEGLAVRFHTALEAATKVEAPLQESATSEPDVQTTTIGPKAIAVATGSAVLTALQGYSWEVVLIIAVLIIIIGLLWYMKNNGKKDQT